MITYLEMVKNIKEKKIPNLSLLSGYTFILLVIISFASIQFSSTKNLNIIETELRTQILELSTLELTDLDIAIFEYQTLQRVEILSNLNSTFLNEDKKIDSESISNLSELYLALEDLGSQLDTYNEDLYRSQAILFITFVGLSIILSILLTVSELDQIKKYERERNKRIIDRNLIDILEKERNLIAIELHDDVAQKLSVISQHFDNSTHEEHSELLKRYNSDVIQKVRTMAQSLRSPEFLLGDFQSQLEFLFADFRSIVNISLDASFNGLTALVLDEEKKLHIYRIIQELLSNCRKHSNASFVKVSLLYVHPELRVFYTDDGVGLDTNRDSSGLGLKSIKYRLRILKAKMRIIPSDGLKIQITFPVEI